MPRRLIKLNRSSSSSTQPLDRRLTTSRSAGDLPALAAIGTATSPPPSARSDHHHHFFTTTSKGSSTSEKRASSAAKGTRGQGVTRVTSQRCLLPMGLLPNPQVSVVCGELYRLSNFGIWCRLWLELRLSYMFFYYDRSDSFPLDVLQLKTYTVHKAPECDHMEDLFPLKLVSDEERKIIFLYAESEECRVKWYAALHRACFQKPSRVIEGLNLDPKNAKLNGLTSRPPSVCVKQHDVAHSWRSFVEQLKTEDETELLNLNASLEHSNETPQELHNRMSTIRHLYDRALEMAEHEVLLRNTYYRQRRMSTQIKVKTLEEQMHKALKGDYESNMEVRLQALQEHLESINYDIKETQLAAEQTFHELETKKAEKLKHLHAVCSSSSGQPHDHKDDDGHEETQRITFIDNDPVKRSTVVKRHNRIRPSAHRTHTFSPGDRLKPPTTEDPITAAFVEGLRKSESVNDLGMVGSHDSPSKRRGPLRMLSQVVLDLKRTKSVDNLAVMSSSTSLSPTSPTNHSSKGQSKGRRFFRTQSHQESPLMPPDSPTNSHFYTQTYSPPGSPAPISPTSPSPFPDYPEMFVSDESENKVNGVEGEEEILHHFQQPSEAASEHHHHHHGSKVGRKIIRMLTFKGKKKEPLLSLS